MPKVDLQVQTQKISSKPNNKTSYNRKSFRKDLNKSPIAHASQVAGIHSNSDLSAVKSKRNLNPFTSPKHSNLIEVAKRFQNNSGRKAP